MKILVYGIQHSCTRLVCGLLDLNKNIKIIHLSNPSGNEKIKLNTIFERRKKNGHPIWDKIVIVTRDLNAVDHSNKNENFGINMLTFLKNDLEEYIKKNTFDENNIVYLSIESLFQHKKNILKQTFKLLGVDDKNYPYDKTGNYNPKDLNGKDYWFSVNLDIKDCNKKYYKDL